MILIYFKYFHQIRIRFGSLGFGTIENLDIEHRNFTIRIRSFEISSISSVIAWQCPLIYIDQIELKISRRSNVSSRKSSTDWRKKLQILQFVSIRIEHFHVEYENFSLTFQRVCLQPNSTSTSKSGEISLIWDQIEILLREQNRRATILAKFFLNSIEIQTNFKEKIFVNATHLSVEIESMTKFSDLFQKSTTTTTTTTNNERTSKFRYVDRNFSEIENENENEIKSNSNRFWTIFDRFVDVFAEPFVDISIRYFQFQYKVADRHYSHLLDAAHFSLHNASKLSDDVRRAFSMKIQLDAQSTFLVHNFSLITVNKRKTNTKKRKLDVILFAGFFV